MHARAVPTREDESDLLRPHGQSRAPGPVFWLRTNPAQAFPPQFQGSGHVEPDDKRPLQRRVRGGISPPSRDARGHACHRSVGSQECKTRFQSERCLVGRICNSCCKMPRRRTLTRRRDATARRATATTVPPFARKEISRMKYALFVCLALSLGFVF